jgi:hypothetical protein
MSDFGLLFEPNAVERVFGEWCDWAEEILFCTPRIDCKNGHSSPWRALTSHISKVRLCIVGDRLPELGSLGQFHARGALRLLDDHGRRHSAHVYVFRRGTDIKALVGSTRLMVDGPAEGIETVTRFEGHRDDPFACAIADLFEECLRRSRLSTSAELAGGRKLEVVTDPKPVNDAGISRLVPIEDTKLIRQLQRGLIESFKVNAEQRRVKLGSRRANAWWQASFGLWGVFLGGKRRYRSVFGLGEPEPNKALNFWVVLDVPKRGVDEEASALFATDPGAERCFLAHRGRHGRSRTRDINHFWRKTRFGGVDLIENDAAHASRIALVSELGSPNLVEQIASFVREVERIRGTSSPPAIDNEGQAFLEADASEQARLVWESLVGLGPIVKDEAVRIAAHELRKRKRIEFGRLDSAGPVYASVVKAMERGIREGIIDRPRYKYIRAIQTSPADYSVSLWKKCLLSGLHDDIITREDAVRLAAAWAVENLGLDHKKLRAGGRVDRGLRRAMAHCLRERTLRQIGREMIQRVEPSRGS